MCVCVCYEGVENFQVYLPSYKGCLSVREGERETEKREFSVFSPMKYVCMGETDRQTEIGERTENWLTFGDQPISFFLMRFVFL